MPHQARRKRPEAAEVRFTRDSPLCLGLTGLAVVTKGLPAFDSRAVLAGEAHANPCNVPTEELTATPYAGTPAYISHDAGRVVVAV